MDSNNFLFEKKDDNYYEILGCNPSSSVNQINTEYRLRALQCHPDKQPGGESCAKQFQKIQEAKDVLSDPQKREDYNRWLFSGLAISYKQFAAARNSAVFHWTEHNTGSRQLEHPTTQKWQPINKSTRSNILSKFRNYEI